MSITYKKEIKEKVRELTLKNKRQTLDVEIRENYIGIANSDVEVRFFDYDDKKHVTIYIRIRRPMHDHDNEATITIPYPQVEGETKPVKIDGGWYLEIKPERTHIEMETEK